MDAPSNTPAKKKKKKKQMVFFDKNFTAWTMSGHYFARRGVPDVDSRACIPLDRNIPRLVRSTLEQLEVVEELYGEREHPVRTLVMHARLYISGLSYAHTLCSAADVLPREGAALRARASEMRKFLRAEEDALIDSGILVPEYERVRARGSDPRDVGLELLALVKRGEETSGFGTDEEGEMSIKLFEAQVVAERLLTELGERDAATTERLHLHERRCLYALVVQRWAALRAGLRTELGDGRRVDALAPPIYVGDA